MLQTEQHNFVETYRHLAAIKCHKITGKPDVRDHLQWRSRAAVFTTQEQNMSSIAIDLCAMISAR